MIYSLSRLRRQPQNKDDLKMKMTSKMKTTSKMKMTSKMKTTSKWRRPQNEDDLKNEDDFKNEDDLKKEDNLKNDDNLKIKMMLNIKNEYDLNMKTTCLYMKTTSNWKQPCLENCTRPKLTQPQLCFFISNLLIWN